MENLRRYSPVRFDATVANAEEQNGWQVVLAYQNEGDGPHLVDLSHRPKWDLQDANLSGIQPLGMKIPDTPGKSVLQKGTLINRMNATQAAVWNLWGEMAELPSESAYTDMTDAWLLLALMGKECYRILEKLSSLDFADPRAVRPRLLQGPIAHVPCQAVDLGEPNSEPIVLFTCSRGYGRSMTEAVLDAGREWGLKPAGMDAFVKRFE